MSTTPIPSPLDLLQQRFAKRCADFLTRQLHVAVRATPLAAAEAFYHDHLFALASPTFLLVLTTSRFVGEMTLEVHPVLAYLILEHLLGGSDPEPFVPNRRFTEMESHLLTPAFEQICQDLSAAWPTAPDAAGPPEFTLACIESDSRARQIVPEREKVMVLPIEFTSGPRPHSPFTNPPRLPRLTLCLPAPALAAVAGSVDSVSMVGRGIGDAERVRFRALLGETALSPAELASVEPGDILTTDVALDAEIRLVATAPGYCELRGRLAKLRNHKAVRITRVLVDPQAGIEPQRFSRPNTNRC